MSLRIIIISISILLFTQAGYAQKPSWVDDASRKKQFDEKEYFTSFLIDSEIDKSSLVAQTKSLKALAQEQIRSILQIQLDQQVNSQKLPYYLVNTKEWQGDIEALTQYQHYYESGERQLYVLAYLKKNDLRKKYETIKTQCQQNITKALEKSRSKLKQKYYKDALKACLDGFAYLRKLELIDWAMATLNNAAPDPKDTFTQKKALSEQLIKVQNYKANSLASVASYIAQCLAIKAKNLDKPVQLLNFTYRNSGINSPFSRKFRQILKTALKGKNIEVAEVNNAILYDAFQRNAYQLKGSYWEDANQQIRLVILLEDGRSGKLITSMDVYLDQSALQQQGIRFKPAHYQKALAQIKIFNQNQSPTRGGLDLDVWTNKGKQNPIFVKGEEVKFYVKANKPCYLRFVYHLADGTTVLLLDNYYIGANKVNQVYEIPEVFECAAPFGLEILHLNAQSRQFANVSTQRVEGYKVIMGGISEFLKSSRGARNARAETKVLITTLQD
ncbi:hypothetical protein BKI52_03975 [marine bacterium AO1-C]|nr:hypothetical protein BKI52_03975 [marine bacterium AO1-C]